MSRNVQILLSCINDFVNHNSLNLKLRQNYQFMYGFLPCAKCYLKLENGLCINDLLTNNRKCSPIGTTKAELLNYDDNVSQFQWFLRELEMLIKKTAYLLTLPYDNVLTHEQIMFLINPKRMSRKKIGENRYMRFHRIKRFYKIQT